MILERVSPIPGVIVLLALAVPSIADARMTVAQAYAAIPHRQTTFSASRSRAPRPERSYLEALFAAVDDAVVARVASYEHLRSGGTQGAYAADYAEVLRRFERLRPPAGLEKAHALIVDATRLQRAYLDAWKRDADAARRSGSKAPRRGGQQEGIRLASQKLRQAWRHLKTRYPDEEATNQQAFFDHLCALDFF